MTNKDHPPVGLGGGSIVDFGVISCGVPGASVAATSHSKSEVADFAEVPPSESSSDETAAMLLQHAPMASLKGNARRRARPTQEQTQNHDMRARSDGVETELFRWKWQWGNICY